MSFQGALSGTSLNARARHKAMVNGDSLFNFYNVILAFKAVPSAEIILIHKRNDLINYPIINQCDTNQNK